MIAVYKPIGLTPLQTLQLLRDQKPELANAKLAYAGKLDPQAEGVMLVLVDEECKERDSWQGLDKVYEWELLLGVATDTHDIMGLITEVNFATIASWQPDDVHAKVNKLLQNFTGKFQQQFPAYSSKSLAARKYKHVDSQENLELASKEVEIYSSELQNLTQVDMGDLLEIIHNRIKRVSGQFRQEEIIATYEQLFSAPSTLKTFLAQIHTHTGSGVYIRQLAHEIGQQLGCGAIAYSIKRTKVGTYSEADSLSLIR